MGIRACALGASLVAASSGALAVPDHDDDAKSALEENPNLRFAPNRVLVGWNAATTQAERDQILTVVQGSVVRAYTLLPDLHLVEVPMDQAEAACLLLDTLPAVAFAELDHVVHPADLPNDEHFSSQWGLHNTGQDILGVHGFEDADIDAPEAWSIIRGADDFVVAVIDTGVNYTHPDLAANIWTNPDEIPGNGIDDDNNGYVDDVHGWDFYHADNDPSDPSDHGTHVAGILGAEANNGIGIAGVLSPVKIMPLRFLGPSGGFVSDAVLAIDYLTEKGVRVSNNSWGGGAYSTALRNAIVTAGNRIDHVYVCSSGNFGWDLDAIEFYPPAYNLANMICVAATNKRDGFASFSNYSPTLVDLAAPGHNIYSTSGADGYRWDSGTSMAAPHVSGVVAAVCIANPQWTFAQVKQQVLSNTRPLDDLLGRTATAGIVNMADALAGLPVNDPPILAYFAPKDGSRHDPGPVALGALANDPQDGDLSQIIEWSSDLQGTLGRGPWVVQDLHAGIHVITASVTDSMGWTVTKSATIDVGEPPNKPHPPSITPFGEQLHVTWTIDTPPAVLAWQIHRQIYDGAWINDGSISLTSPDARSFVDTTTVAPSVRYRVRAQNERGWGRWSNWAQLDR